MLFNQCFTFKPANITLSAPPVCYSHSKCSVSMGAVYAHRLRRWPNIKTTMAQRLVFAEKSFFTLCFENDGHSLYLQSSGICSYEP